MKSSSVMLSAALLVTSLTLALRPPVAPAPATLLVTDPFIGEIVLFGGNFAPEGWATCEGQLLPISQNAALFSILGTTYGGDGRTTFRLPDLRGRTPIGQGNGPGLSSYQLGQAGGIEQTSLSIANLPSHSHQLMGQMQPGGEQMTMGNVMATSPNRPFYGAHPNVSMHVDAIGNTGGAQPHDNRQPFVSMTYIIALQGIFPSRQ